MESHALVRSLVASVRFWLGFHGCGTSLLYRVPRSRSFRQAVSGRWGSSSTSPMLWSGCIWRSPDVSPTPLLTRLVINMMIDLQDILQRVPDHLENVPYRREECRRMRCYRMAKQARQSNDQHQDQRAR